MINLAKNNWKGPFIYNDELFEYILKNGKKITDAPKERDSNIKSVSPLIHLCHVPTKKVNAYKSWFFFHEGNAYIHTEGGQLKANNDDFMYLIYSDDPRMSKENQIKVYDKISSSGIGKFRNFINEKTEKKFLSDKENFDTSYTDEELKSSWYKKFIEKKVEN